MLGKIINLLIVDDDKSTTSSLKALISNKYKNINVETAENGQEALLRIRKGGINAVLTDVAMPKMDGCDLYMSIMEIAPEIQVIMMSAYYDANHAVVRAKLEGLKDVVPGPELIEKRVLADKIFEKIEKNFLKDKE